MFIPGGNFEEEQFDTRATREARWEELMQVKPHVVKTTSWVADEKGVGRTIWIVRYPRLVV